jgi:hypothetical protein
VNTGSLPLLTPRNKPFDLLGAVTWLKRAGTVKSWPVKVAKDSTTISGCVCTIRKTKEAIKMAHEKIRNDAARKGKQVQPQTLEFAKYVILFTNFPHQSFTASEVLEW